MLLSRRPVVARHVRRPIRNACGFGTAARIFPGIADFADARPERKGTPVFIQIPAGYAFKPEQPRVWCQPGSAGPEPLQIQTAPARADT